MIDRIEDFLQIRVNYILITGINMRLGPTKSVMATAMRTETIALVAKLTFADRRKNL
jgi:hypothetical protein